MKQRTYYCPALHKENLPTELAGTGMVWTVFPSLVLSPSTSSTIFLLLEAGYNIAWVFTTGMLALTVINSDWCERCTQGNNDCVIILTGKYPIGNSHPMG